MAGIDVGNLADGIDLIAGGLIAVEQGRLGRGNGEVAAIAGALEGGGGLADEWPRDHASDPERIDQPAHHLAEFIKPLQAEMDFMARSTPGYKLPQALAVCGVGLGERYFSRRLAWS